MAAKDIGFEGTNGFVGVGATVTAAVSFRLFFSIFSSEVKSDIVGVFCLLFTCEEFALIGVVEVDLLGINGVEENPTGIVLVALLGGGGGGSRDVETLKEGVEICEPSLFLFPL